MTKYTVQPGDTLTRIAGRAGVTVNDLVKINHLADPDKIKVGQVLLIGRYTGNASHDEPQPVKKTVPQLLDACMEAIDKLPEFQALMEAVEND